MKKINIKKAAFIISIVFITGFASYAFANMGFGSHMSGYRSNGHHMNSYNGDKQNHMYNSGQMGANMNNGHMFNNEYRRDSNHMYEDMNKFHNGSRQNFNKKNTIKDKTK
jgi:hypothetical protein